MTHNALLLKTIMTLLVITLLASSIILWKQTPDYFYILIKHFVPTRDIDSQTHITANCHKNIKNLWSNENKKARKFAGFFMKNLFKIKTNDSYH